MRAVRAAALAACLCAAATSACVAEPFDGRWAADARACASESAAASLLRVNALSLQWGDAISSVPITLRMRGEHLLLRWAGAPTEELWRCR